MSNRITFRTDEEVDNILDSIPMNCRSDFIREAIKFYYHYKDKKTLDSAISELVQVTAELQKATQNIATQRVRPSEQENLSIESKEADFSSMLLNIGQQFVTWGQEPVYVNSDVTDKTPGTSEIIDDDDLEF